MTRFSTQYGVVRVERRSNDVARCLEFRIYWRDGRWVGTLSLPDEAILARGFSEDAFRFELGVNIDRLVGGLVTRGELAPACDGVQPTPGIWLP